MTSDNKLVENKDLIQTILDKVDERNALKAKTIFEWVKGHNDDLGNEEADHLAVSGAQRRRHWKLHGISQMKSSTMMISE